jgi:antitoxin (DNA-binding transcriptional repressor) of toxin-antitoxin stability system
MEKAVSATEAVKKFSEILNSVKYRGESFTIIRGGKPVASISPVENLPKRKPLRELRELVKNLPRLGDEADRFAKDLKEIRKHQPVLPKETKWG